MTIEPFIYNLTLQVMGDNLFIDHISLQNGIPVFTAELARGTLPESHPLSLGSANQWLNPASRHISEADAVVLIGADPRGRRTR